MRHRDDKVGEAGVGRPVCGAVVAVVIAAFVVSGCPTYESSYSGTYRERSANPAASERGQQAVEIDFFRYGDHAKAILRYYKPDLIDNTEPFGEETFCTWTRADADAFRGSSRQFELVVPGSTKISDGRLDGEMVGETTIEAGLYNTETGEAIWEPIALDRVDGEPDPTCEGIEDFLVHPTFNLRNDRPNRLPSGTDYEIAHPVLSVQWVAHRPRTGGAAGPNASPELVPIGETGWSKRLGSQYFGGASGAEFRDSVSMLLSPPPEKFRSSVGSGSLQFAIGHVVVVDDSAGEGRFEWNDNTEPIVASALQNGVWPDGPAAATGSGKAVLYVDGDIEELAEKLGNFRDPKLGIQPRISGLNALEESEVPDRSFFVADVAVDFSDNNIVQLEVQPRVTQSTIPVQATNRHVNGKFSRLRSELPRLRPR